MSNEGGGPSPGRGHPRGGGKSKTYRAFLPAGVDRRCPGDTQKGTEKEPGPQKKKDVREGRENKKRFHQVEYLLINQNGRDKSVWSQVRRKRSGDTWKRPKKPRKERILDRGDGRSLGQQSKDRVKTGPMERGTEKDNTTSSIWQGKTLGAPGGPDEEETVDARATGTR